MLGSMKSPEILKRETRMKFAESFQKAYGPVNAFFPHSNFHSHPLLVALY